MNSSRAPEDPLEGLLKKGFENDAPPEVQKRLQSRFTQFRVRVQARDEDVRPGWRAPWLFLRVAAGVCVTALVILGLATMLIGGASPTWAEVLERFAGVPFFNATVYVKAGPVSDPVQLELWMTKGGKLRLRAGNQVIFGEKGRIVEMASLKPDAKTSDTVENAREIIQQIVENMGALDAFSFETFMHALPFTGVFSPPLPNQNVSISNDLAVFDITNPDRPDWIRIWALRQSRLPVRILFWNPNDGESIDVVLSYANDQPPEFFDPEAFREALAHSAPDTVGRAYLLFKDPGGRPITPEDVRARPPSVTETLGQT